MRRNRRRVVDAREEARRMREDFYDKKSRHSERMPFTWPTELQDVGRCLSVAYSSDKWKSEREFEDYKHIAEAPQHLLTTRGFLVDWETDEPIDAVGPWVELPDPMPRHFAKLARFIGLQFHLYSECTPRGGRLGRSADDVMEFRLRRGMLGAAKLPEDIGVEYPELGIRAGAPVLLVYTLEQHGVHALITGKQLGVEKDGIVG